MFECGKAIKGNGGAIWIYISCNYYNAHFGIFKNVWNSAIDDTVNGVTANDILLRHHRKFIKTNILLATSTLLAAYKADIDTTDVSQAEVLVACIAGALGGLLIDTLVSRFMWIDVVLSTVIQYHHQHLNP